MKTLRAFLWGSALGALVGLILAPRRDTIANARLSEERARAAAAPTETQAAPGMSATPATPDTRAQPTSPTMGQGTPAMRRYVGNLNTRIYHEATATNLPNEENRTFFATPEEAEAAGYRAAQ